MNNVEALRKENENLKKESKKQGGKGNILC